MAHVNIHAGKRARTRGLHARTNPYADRNKDIPIWTTVGDKCLFANTYQGRQRVRADGVSQPPPTPFVSPVLMPRHRSRYSCKAEWTYRREAQEGNTCWPPMLAVARNQMQASSSLQRCHKLLRHRRPPHHTSSTSIRH